MSKVYTNASLDRLFSEATGISENISYELSYRLGVITDKKGKDKFSYPFTMVPNGKREIKKINTIKLSQVQKGVLDFHQRDYLRAISEMGQEYIILKVKSTSPYISGLGEPHVTETGLTLHGTYGVPFLAGSGIKGMFHAWCLEAFGGSKAQLNDRDLQSLFGVEGEDGTDREKGILTFHDVLFPELIVEPDIMTSHNMKYYDTGVLTEGENTNPVNFMRVKFSGEAALIISSDSRESKYNLEEIVSWLATALEEYGLGAKTAIGYGRFSAEIDRDAKIKILEEQEMKKKAMLDRERRKADEKRIQEEKQKEAERLAEMSEDDRFVYQTLAMIEQAASDKQLLDNTVKSDEFIDRILSHRELVQAVSELFKAEDIWKKPSKKMASKISKLKQALQE